MTSSARRPTPLTTKLAEQIRHEGPISVADYMRTCLHDRDHGYYRKQRAIGRDGDFVTAPEISQVFGELIGLWCAVVWQQMGSPPSIRLVELGPGRGTLMRDALKAARAVPDFCRALRVHLVESNALLIEQQRATLKNETVPIAWAVDLDTKAAGDRPAIVIANEFLDTIPVTQWVFHDAHWRIRRVGLDTAGLLSFTHGNPDPNAPLPPGIPAEPQEGDIFETRCGALVDWAGKLAALGAPLAALVIDYGHLQSAIGDTLQAIRAHRYEDPLAEPGEADLTAHVDFAEFGAEMARYGFCLDGPVTQAAFLGSLGIVERASRLMAANPDKAAAIEGAVARLMAAGGMGSRFKAVGVRGKGLPPLPGFEAVDIGRAGN